jgi:hypothetical protein
MTTEQWRTGRRENAGFCRIAPARALKVSDRYLSQLETGLRASSAALTRKAARPPAKAACARLSRLRERAFLLKWCSVPW